MIRLLWNSVLVAGLGTIFSCVLAFFAALFVFTLKPAARRSAMTVSILTLVLPPFLITNCWLHLLGFTGSWRQWWPFEIYSLAGVVWIFALTFWPIAFLLCLAAWQKIDATLFEVEPALRGLGLVRWLLWPTARRALAHAAVITFALQMNQFSVPAILQVKVLPAELWLRLSTQLDARGAFIASIPGLLVALSLVILVRGRAIEWPRFKGEGTRGVLRGKVGMRLFTVSSVVFLVLVFFSAVLPLSELLLDRTTWRDLPKVERVAPMLITYSVLFAGGSALTSVILAMLGWRIRFAAATWLLFFTPGVMLGAALIFLFNRPGFDVFYASPAVVIVGLALRYFAISWQGTRLAMLAADASLVDVVRLEAASRWALLRNAYLPQVMPAIGATAYLGYVFALWDVETLILIYPPGGETLALRVFNLLHYGHIGQVNALCLILLALALAPGALWLCGRWAVKSIWLIIFVFVIGCSRETNSGLSSKLFTRVEIIGHRGTGAGELNKPRSVAVDREDNLYVVDMTGRVQKFSPSGSFLLSWQMPQTDKGKPKGMCRDREGRIVVLEPHYSRVNHFSPDGHLQQQWGAHGTNTGELAFPRSVGVNSLGNIFVTEYGITERVQCFASDGKKWLFTFGEAGDGPGQFNRPEGLGIDASNRVYVADSCNHRVQIFSADGRFIATYGRPGTGPGEFSYPYDVRVDATGQQFVAEFGNNRIQIFDVQNRLVEVVGGPGSALGKFNNPWSIALDSRGNLYVADANNHRVQKFIRAAQ